MPKKNNAAARPAAAEAAPAAGSAAASAAGPAEPGDRLQRPPAEVRFADELAELAARDAGRPRPPGWRLSMQAVRAFIAGDPALGVQRKFVGDPSLVDRALVSLATSRGLMLVGEPGTAKSLLSELIAAAVCGTSSLTIQGGAATTEDQIKYSWNYALLVSEGPGERALVPAPLLEGMARGLIVRFEEITRCPLEVQDTLLSPLSERALAIPELGAAGTVFARAGFNVIATANTRDRGVNEMSAALKRRFNFETVFPIPDFATELALVRAESARLLQDSGVLAAPRKDVLEVLMTVFRELRTGRADGGTPVDRPSAVMSAAEAVSVAHAVGLRGWFLRGEPGDAADLAACLAGTVAKDNPDDLARLRRYLEKKAPADGADQWQALYEARHLLPG